MDTETGTAAGTSKSPKKLAALIIVIALLAAGGFVAYSKGWLSLASFSQGKTVALVNGEALKERELNLRFDQLKPSYESQGVDLADATIMTDIKTKLVEEMVNEELVVQEAQKTDLSVTDEDVNTAFDQIKAQLGDEAAFQARLKELSMSESELAGRIKRELLIQKYIERFATEQSITVTDEEINTFYQNFSQGRTDVPPLTDVRTDVEQEVKRQKLAQKIVDLVAELKQGADIQILL